MDSFQIKFNVKFVGNLKENEVKLQVHLDKAFKTKSTIISTQGKEVAIHYNFPKFPEEAKANPCVIIQAYRKRKHTFTRTGIYKTNWYDLIKANIHQKMSYVISHTNKPMYAIHITGFEIKGKFNHEFSPQLDQIVSKSIDEISSSIYYFLDNNFDFTKLEKVAIFYRDDLMYRMDLLSQLIVKNAKDYSNPDAWLNLLGKLKEAYVFLKDMKTATSNTKIMKKPRPIEVKTSWVDLICYIVTRGYNYRTDYPKDNYSEPSTNKNGDCEDLSLIILAFYQLFTSCDFLDDKYNELMQMQRYARRYIPFFTFCLTGSQQFGAAASVPNSASGHICTFFISKVSFMNRIKDEKLKKMMWLKDKSNIVHDEGDRHYLIGESTNLVRPFIEDDNYDGFDPVTFSTLQKMLQIQNIVSYETVDDNVTVRVISDPNSDFYRKFGMLFTPYFYNLEPNAKNVYYGVVCGTKNTQMGKKPFYGIDFEDFNLYSKNMSFHPLPPLPNQFVKLSENMSRYQVPLTLFKFGKNGFESSIEEGSELFYPKFKLDKRFEQKLNQMKMTNDLNGQYEMRAYAYLSDEDMNSENMRLSLIQFLKSNDIKVKHKQQELNYDTNTHLFGFYKKKQNPIVYLNIVPVSNKFLI